MEAWALPIFLDCITGSENSVNRQMLGSPELVREEAMQSQL